MNAVFTTPEARPDSLGSTPSMAASSTGFKAMPAPRPKRSMPGNTCIQKSPCTGALANKTSPMAASNSPAISGTRMPQRITMRADRPSENAAISRLDGKNASPTCMAL